MRLPAIGAGIAATTFSLSSPEHQHHADLWHSMEERSSWSSRVDKVVNRIRENEDRYRAAEQLTGVPWEIIAVLHNMESGGSFDHHMHEGSPLTGRTKWVPKGRPLGDPPFTWEESCYDALITLKRMDEIDYSDIGEILYTLEKFNGLGYLKYRGINTPYLWSGSYHYTKGKYVADGKYSRNAVSKQVGAAVILKRLGFSPRH